MPVPMVCATCEPKIRKATKLKKAAQDDRVLRAQHARRDDGGDRVRGVVQAVEEIEGERDHDERDQDRQGERDGVHVNQNLRYRSHHTFSSMMPWISLATSSKRSTTFSRWS